MSEITCSEKLKALTEGHAANRARFERLMEGVAAEAHTAKPGNGGWSIDEVCRHLAVTHGLYATRLASSLKEREASGDSPWPAAGWFGRFLLKGMAPDSKPIKAPPLFGPKRSDPAAGGKEQLISRWKTFETLLKEAEGKPLGKPRFKSPMLGIILRLTPAEGMEVMVAHDRRHLDQIERLVTANA